MKFYTQILIGTLASLTLLIGCGDSKDVVPQEKPAAAKPAPTPEPTPVPVKNECDNPSLLGDWDQAKVTNAISFKKDCSVVIQDTELKWSIDGNTDYLVFKSGLIEVDVCAYQIKTAGGLGSDLTIVLSLICEKSGILSYTKSIASK